jgi:hypothetical protein
MFKEKKKIIDGTEFNVAPFDAGEAFKLQATLGKLFGPSLGAALGAIKKQKGNVDINGTELSKALQSLFDQLSEDTLFALVTRLLKNVTCSYSINNAPPTIFDFSDQFTSRFNIVFQGRLLVVYQLIAFVLEVNYPDFFLKIGTVFGDRFRTIMSPQAKENDEND